MYILIMTSLKKPNQWFDNQKKRLERVTVSASCDRERLLDFTLSRRVSKVVQTQIFLCKDNRHLYKIRNCEGCCEEVMKASQKTLFS